MATAVNGYHKLSGPTTRGSFKLEFKRAGGKEVGCEVAGLYRKKKCRVERTQNSVSRTLHHVKK
jgi:hypothetical protein